MEEPPLSSNALLESILRELAEKTFSAQKGIAGLLRALVENKVVTAEQANAIIDEMEKTKHDSV